MDKMSVFVRADVVVFLIFALVASVLANDGPLTHESHGELFLGDHALAVSGCCITPSHAEFS